MPGVITKLPGVNFTDTTIPKLYRDAVITTGTRQVVDSLDPFSYAKQAAATTADVWKDLTPNANNAAFNTSFTFTNGGFEVVNGGNSINLGTSTKRAAGDAGFVQILWLKHIAVNSTLAYGWVAGCADNNNALLQWLIDTGPTNSGQYRLQTGASTWAVTPAVGAVFQCALAAKKLNGVIEYYLYVNGVETSRAVSADTAIRVPTTQTASQVGGSWGPFGAGANFRVFRSVHDDTSSLATEAAITAFVAADYTANTGRFT